jgi:AbrB family looped-hinge helix DNA binding protein
MDMKNSPEVYGTVKVGQRGQVVIPMKARKVLKIKEGDQLIAMSGPPGKNEIISFIPVGGISEFLKHFEDRITALKNELSKQTKK